MNILFIEDERELRDVGVAQLESCGHTVYPVSDLAEAHEVMTNPSMPVKLVVADQSLPDGQGLRFILEMKPLFPNCIYVIVSGCLTDQHIQELKANEIPYYHKPLLYGKLVETLRRGRMKHVTNAPFAPAPVVTPAPVVEETPAPPIEETPSEEATLVEEVVEADAPKRKKWFGLWG